MASVKYTDNQVQFLVDRRAAGVPWPELVPQFNREFKCRASKKSLIEVVSKRGRKKRPARSHLLIPDCQVKPGVPLDHLYACADLIKARQPEVIVNIGDFYDMHSLNAYDTGKKAQGRLVQADVDAGNAAMKILDDAIQSVQGYNPRLIFTLGNHEQRIERYVNNTPELEGWLGYNNLSLGMWEVIPFLEIAEVDGVHYSHYFYNKNSGRPLGGSIENRLNKLGFSFSMGHEQTLAFGRRDLNNGDVIQGLVAGAFYMHDEGYKGYQGNFHFRGLVYKHNVQAGNYDPEFISIERLLKGDT